jgi:dihydroneopterin aldolase
MGRIILNGIKFRANIGTTNEERQRGNDITINLSYSTDTLKPGLTDDLNDAVDYSLIFQAVKKETLTPCNLIENLAHRILTRLKKEFPQISDVKLQLFKHYPQVDGELECSGIEIN